VPAIILFLPASYLQEHQISVPPPEYHQKSYTLSTHQFQA